MKQYTKRNWIFLSTTAMAMAIPMSAGASAALTKVGSADQYTDWVYNSTLLRTEGNSGCGLQSVDGTELTGQIYGRSFTTSYGYMTGYEAGEELNSGGAVDENGKILVPFQYAAVEVQSRDWIFGIMLEEATATQYDYTSWLSSDTYYLIQSVDVYSVQDGSASCVATLTRDQYQDAETAGSYLLIQDRTTSKYTMDDAQFNAVAENLDDTYDLPIETRTLIPFSENGQYGIQDTDGNVVMEPSFKYVYDYNQGYAEVSTGDLEGLIDTEGTVVVPAEYERIQQGYYLPYDAATDRTSGYNAFGYFCVVKDGKVGFVQEGGNVTCEPKYSKDAMEVEGASAMLTDTEGKKTIIAADGTETSVEGYEDIRVLDYSAGMLYRVNNADSQYGLIDWHGEEVLPCEYSDISASGDGQYLLIQKEYGDEKELYQIAYTLDGAVAEETGEAADAVAEEATEAAEISSEAAGAASDTTAAAELLKSAVSILSNDTAENRAAAVTLINNAAGMLGEEQSTAVTLLNSAATLLNTDTGLSDIITVLNSAAELLK